MANQLKMAVVQAIIALQRMGWSQRRIAQELGIDRETVARYIHSPPTDSKPATNPIPGSDTVTASVSVGEGNACQINGLRSSSFSTLLQAV